MYVKRNKILKFLSIIVIFLNCFLLLSACRSESASREVTSASKVTYDSNDENADWDASNSVNIILNDSTVTVDDNGVSADGSNITISNAGTYIVSGKLTDGQIVINAGDSDIVRLVLNGADLTCLSSAPIFVENAEKVVIILADGTQNKIVDGISYKDLDENSEPDAAIFSKCDLTINGNGLLIIDANYNNGIKSKDELKIMSGAVIVNSIDDGIIGRDFAAVKDGDITISAQGDGLKSTNDEDSSKGFVYIEGGTFDITAGADGIQAENAVYISAGNIAISSGGGSSNSINNTDSRNVSPGSSSSAFDTNSGKGIKAAVNITISSAAITVDSADDAIHSNDTITLSDANIMILSGDDGIHSDTTIEIDGGTIDIEKSYEGIESAVITINDGDIRIISSDDGINVAGGNDNSSQNGRLGQNNVNSSSNNYFYVNGGTIYIDAIGDGIDVNGSIKMTGGEIIVNGPVSDGNGALDYDGSFAVTGGSILAAGSAGMAMAPDTTSTQYSIMISFSGVLKAGTLIHIESADGKQILTFASAKNFQNVVFCSAALTKGPTYKVYYGGSCTGTIKDGIYTDGTYISGTLFKEFTVSSILTNVGTVNRNQQMRP